MTSAAVFVDVNIPMYAAGQDHPYKPACVWVMTEIAAQRLEAVIDTEIVQEALHRFGALRRWETGEKMANTLCALFPLIHPVTREEAQRAVALFAEFAPCGPRARDLVHVAVMRQHGISRIISTDRHFDLIPDLTRLDPQALYDEAHR